MPGAEIVIITQGGGGNRINAEYGTPYSVAAGDTAENEGAGAKELLFTTGSGTSVIPLAGYSGHEFTEAGTVAVYQ